MTIIAAIINIICYLIGGTILIGLAFNPNKSVYRPGRGFRLALIIAGVCMFGLAGGYSLLLLKWGNLKWIQFFWLLPLLSIVAIGYAGTALYTIRQARAYEQMRQDFITTAAHELRTPLTIIWGFADILTTQFDELPPAALLKYLHMVHNQTAILGGHVQDILAFERGRYTDMLPPEPVDLTALLQERIEVIGESIARQAGVEITVEAATAVTVLGYTDKIRLIINNLLTNAVKFSPPATTGGRVQVALYVDNDHAVIAVHDEGVGISPAFMPHLFEPFQQERRDVRRPFNGMGIGLAAAQSMAGMMGGKITAVSELGEGSTFRVRLPLGGRP